MMKIPTEYITYGKPAFDPAKFQPVKNREYPWIKPEGGGLWASPAHTNWGWAEWCKAESFGDLDCSFHFTFTGRIFVVDSLEDARRLPWLYIYQAVDFSSMEPRSFHQIGQGIDFEALARDWDALLLTEAGERDTRFNRPSLYGWDCESILIFNPAGIVPLRKGVE